MVAFFASFTAIIGTPVVAPVGAWLLARQRSIVQRRSFQLLLGGLGCVATGLWFGVATALYEVNAVLLGLAYLAFGVVAISAFRLRPRLLGFSLGTVATLFLLASLLLGTVGALGVAFIVGDTVPIHSELSELNLKCYVTSFGNATTSTNGYNVVLKRQLPFAPVFEYSVGGEQFESPSFEPKEACMRARNAEAGYAIIPPDASRKSRAAPVNSSVRPPDFSPV